MAWPNYGVSDVLSGQSYTINIFTSISLMTHWLNTVWNCFTAFVACRVEMDLVCNLRGLLLPRIIQHSGF